MHGVRHTGNSDSRQRLRHTAPEASADIQQFREDRRSRRRSGAGTSDNEKHRGDHGRRDNRKKLPGSWQHIHAENTAGYRGRVPHRGVHAGASGAPACQRIALYMSGDRDTRRGRQPLQPRGDRKTAAAHQGRSNDCGKRRRNAPDCKGAALRPDNARRDDAGNVRRGGTPEAAQRPRQPLPGDPRCGADRGRGSRRPGALHERGLRRVPLKADNLRGA